MHNLCELMRCVNGGVKRAEILIRTRFLFKISHLKTYTDIAHKVINILCVKHHVKIEAALILQAG
jgi:hypothetical protein